MITVANMVAALRLDGQPLPSTRTELYTVMVVNTVRRATAKSRKGSMAADTLDDLPVEEKTALAKIGQVALKGLKQQCYVFNLEKEVPPVFGDAAQRLGFVEEFRTVSVRGQRHKVQFSHLTYQEYMAVYFVAHAANVESELESCRRTIGCGEEAVPFWRFIGGMLGREKVNVLMSFLSRLETARERRSSGEHLLFQMSCFADAMDQPQTDDTTAEEGSASSIQEATLAFLPRAVDLSNQLLCSSDCHTLSVSLCHSSHVTTDISSEHSLRTCTQVRRNVRKSDAVYACKKKNATEVTVSGIHDLPLRRGDFIAVRGPPMWSPLFLPKESSHKFAVVFVNVMHF